MSGAGCRSSTSRLTDFAQLLASSVWRRGCCRGTEPCRLSTPSTPVVRLNRNWCGAARPAWCGGVGRRGEYLRAQPQCFDHRDDVVATGNDPAGIGHLDIGAVIGMHLGRQHRLLVMHAGSSAPATRCQPAGNAVSAAAGAAGGSAAFWPSGGVDAPPQAASTSETANGSAHRRRRDAVFMLVLLAGRAARPTV